MKVDELQQSAGDVAAPGIAPNNDNRVNVRVNDTVGSIFLGLVTLALLIAYLRSEARVRALLSRMNEDD